MQQRRVVTGHDAAGRSVVTGDERYEADVARSVVWTTGPGADHNNDPTDGATREGAGITMPGGTLLRIIEQAPGGATPMHRTSSIDYGIVLDGECELELDGGEVVALRAGDVVVQRGTRHLWRNPTDRPCRYAFVLIHADPARVGGAPLLPELFDLPSPTFEP